MPVNHKRCPRLMLQDHVDVSTIRGGKGEDNKESIVRATIKAKGMDGIMNYGGLNEDKYHA
jgi:hypothetical protein